MIRVPLSIKGWRPTHVVGRILTSEKGVTAHNDFGSPNIVSPKPFKGVKISDDGIEVTMPQHSVVVLEMR